MPKRINVEEDPLWTSGDHAEKMYDPRSPVGEVPGESANRQIDSFIEREAKRRESELGESPDRARAQADFMDIAEESNLLTEQGISAVVGAYPPERPRELGGRQETFSSTARGISELEADLQRATQTEAFTTSQQEPSS